MNRIGSGGIKSSWAPPEAHLSWGTDPLQSIEVLWPSGYLQVVSPVPDVRILRIEEPELLSVSKRHAAAGSDELIEVVVTPYDQSGALMGPDLQVSVESTLGTWTEPLRDMGDGSYHRTLKPALVPGRAVIEAAIEGQAIRTRPIVEFR